MSGSNDWLGGYTLEELLGSAPVSKVEKKPSAIAKIIGAPFRLIAAIVKLPVTIATRIVGGVVGAVTEVAKLPIRLLGALVSPWRRKNS